MGQIVGAVLNTAGGLIGGSRAADAAAQQAASYRNAATQASNLAQFRPVGTTTNFGTSNYVYDPETGRMTSAGYSLNPQLQGLQNGLMGAAASYNYQPNVGFINGIRENSLAGMRMAMQQAPNAFNAGNELYARSKDLYPQADLAYGQGQSLFGQGTQVVSQGTALANQAPELFSRAADLYTTGAGYLNSPAQAEADYLERTRAALAPQDEQTLARLRNQIYQTGRSGLAVGGTEAGRMLATNPELAAYYNSLQQRELDMATKAQAEGRTNVALGASLYGAGGQLGSTGANIAGTAGTIAGTGAQIQGVGGQLFNVGANQYQTAGGLVGVGNQSLATGGGLLKTSSDLGSAAINQELGKYQIQNAALNTLGNYLGQAKTVESMGMQPYTMSNEMAGNVANAGAQQGRFQMSGETSAAPLTYANASYSPTAQFFQGAGSSFGGGQYSSSNNPINTWFSNFISPNPVTNPGTFSGNKFQVMP